MRAAQAVASERAWKKSCPKDATIDGRVSYPGNPLFTRALIEALLPRLRNRTLQLEARLFVRTLDRWERIEILDCARPHDVAAAEALDERLEVDLLLHAIERHTGEHGLACLVAREHE